MADLKTIESLTEDYSKARDLLAERLRTVEDEQQRIVRRYLRGLKSAADDLAAKLDNLAAVISTNPVLFEKPRSRVFAGIKVGLQKGSGSLEYDKTQVVKAIKKHLQEQADVLLKVDEKPVNSALQQLDAKTLKRIGVTVTPGKDQVLIKPANSDIEKLIKAWLSDLADLEVEA